MKIAAVRRYALSLPQTTEEPHFDFASFRVRGKIYATVPPGETHLHVFVDEVDRERYVAMFPDAYAPLVWGKKTMGVRVTLAGARDADVRELLQAAWQRRAPKSLAAAPAPRERKQRVPRG